MMVSSIKTTNRDTPESEHFKKPSHYSRLSCDMRIQEGVCGGVGVWPYQKVLPLQRNLTGIIAVANAMAIGTP